MYHDTGDPPWKKLASSRLIDTRVMISTTKPGSLGDNNPLITASQVQSGVNAQRTTVAGVQNGKSGILGNGNTTIAISGDNLYINQGAAKGTGFTFQINRASTGLKAYQTGTIAPSVATNFPNDGDFGFYENTTGPTYYWTINHGGALKNISLSTLTGTLGVLQHGDQSANATALHAFTQISGNIIDAQHGDRSTTTTNMHKFLQITGTITPTQHGDITGSTTINDRHAAATATLYGFQSPTQFSLVATATIDDDSSSLTLRTSVGDVRCRRLQCSGTQGGSFLQVVSERNTGWSSPSGVDGSGKGAFNAASATLVQTSQAVGSILDLLRNWHGLTGA